MKKTSNMLGLAILLLLLTGCSDSDKKPSPPETTIMIEDTQSESVPTSEATSGLSFPIKPHPMDDYPRVDGSTATIPLSEQYAADMMNVPIEEARLYIYHNKTHQAYINLIEGNADIIFVTAPSEEELSLADDAGVELEIIPIVQEGFVFLVNQQNPVKSLTCSQIVDIYSGKITNWQDVGGDAQEIIPYQRPYNSGSQSGMLDLVMGDTPLTEPPEQFILSYMSELISTIAAYKSGKNSIGYSYYYYATTMYVEDDVRLLAVNGVEPSSETIRDGSYPYTTAYYAVLRKNELEGSKARNLLNWILENGSTSAVTAGYVPVKEPAIESSKKHSSYLFAEEDFEIQNEIQGMYRYASMEGLDSEAIQYYQVTNLKDKEVQKLINDRIASEAISLYYRDLPPYRGILTSTSADDLYNVSVCCKVLNSGNLLSLLLERRLYNDGGEGKSVYEAVPLTFFTMTGEEVLFSDLFSEGYDYQSEIADYVTHCIVDDMEPYDNMDPKFSRDSLIALSEDSFWHAPFSYAEMIKPLKMICASQKYVIIDNTLHLILDYEVPEISLEYDWSYTYTTLPLSPWLLKEYGNGLAITEKYGNISECYVITADTPEVKLKQDTSVSRQIWHSDNPEIKKYKDYGAEFRLSISNNPGNQSLHDMIEDRIAGAEQILIDFLSGASADLEEYYKWLIYCYSTERHGRFLQEYTLIYAANSGRFTHETYRVYDTITGTQIQLADCFVPGIDYKALLTPLLKEKFDISDLESWEDINISFSSDGYFVMDLSRSYSESGDGFGSNSKIVLSPEIIGMENLATFD